MVFALLELVVCGNNNNVNRTARAMGKRWSQCGYQVPPAVSRVVVVITFVVMLFAAVEALTTPSWCQHCDHYNAYKKQQ